MSVEVTCCPLRQGSPAGHLIPGQGSLQRWPALYCCSCPCAKWQFRYALFAGLCFLFCGCLMCQPRGSHEHSRGGYLVKGAWWSLVSSPSSGIVQCLEQQSTKSHCFPFFGLCVCVCGGGEWVMLRVPICPQDKHRGISFAYFHLVSIQACAHRCNFIYIARGNASTATGKLCNNGKLWISLQASLFEWPEPLWGMCTPSLPESSWKLKQFLQGHQTWEVERFWAGFSSSVPSTVPFLPFACLSLDLHLVNH